MNRCAYIPFLQISELTSLVKNLTATDKNFRQQQTAFPCRCMVIEDLRHHLWTLFFPLSYTSLLRIQISFWGAQSCNQWMQACHKNGGKKPNKLHNLFFQMYRTHQGKCQQPFRTHGTQLLLGNRKIWRQEVSQTIPMQERKKNKAGALSLKK